MTQKVIQIPRINDGRFDFAKLFTIRSRTDGYAEDVRFDFSGCDFLRPNAVAFLGGLARLIESRKGRVEFDWSSLREQVLTNICQNGFAGNFGHPNPPWSGNSIPYREDKTQDVGGIMDYLEQYWLRRGWMQVSRRLRDAIVGHMWEIYNNAFEHSGSGIGVFTCGQHFPGRSGSGNETLVLSVVDFGQGIPAKIRDFFRRHADEESVARLTGASCLRWAFEAGTTTKVGEPGGSGLALLKEFVRINQGKLEIYSNDGYAIVDKDGERYENHNPAFEGTVVHITLRCDENLYRFRGEAE